LLITVRFGLFSSHFTREIRVYERGIGIDWAKNDTDNLTFGYIVTSMGLKKHQMRMPKPE